MRVGAPQWSLWSAVVAFVLCGSAVANAECLEFGAPCNDGSACTFPDLCDFFGNCISGLPLDCNDDEPCTVDTCDPETGCVATPDPGKCEDGDPCTEVGFCVDAVCQGQAPVDCDDSEPCTIDFCDPAQGCSHQTSLAFGSDCDDGDACTVPDVCDFFGDCVSGLGIDCNDDEPCTADDCEAELGCVFTPIDGACDDGDLCTHSGTCSSGVCVGSVVLECDDGNPCTVDLCLPTAGCIHDSASQFGQPCTDGDACTTPDVCGFAGACSPGLPIDCNDGEPCTTDDCDEMAGCTHDSTVGTCDDGDLCTEPGTCAAGVCTNQAPVDCDDANPCTTDLCLPTTGCAHSPTALFGSACDDGDACTAPDVCDFNGTCAAGLPVDCDDLEPCTADDCSPTNGCSHDAIAGPCEDGDPCTEPGICVDGECTGQVPLDCDDGNACTADLCIEGEGCQHDALSQFGQPCDDGEPCTTPDVCDFGGNCAPGLAIDCDDGNPCTGTTCDGTGQCAFPEADWSDITVDGDTSVVDVQCMILFALEQIGSSDSVPACVAVPPLDADVNCSGAIDIADVQLIVARALSIPLDAAVDSDGNTCADSCDSL